MVFATLHTQDAGSTVDRLIDVYPENQQQQIRVQVASTLRAVIVQTLIPRATGHGRAPATEVMINTPAVSLIRSGKAHQIRTVLQSGEKEGMHTLDQDLARLVNKGVITFEDALVKVQVREEFESSAAREFLVLRMAGTAGAWYAHMSNGGSATWNMTGTARIHARPRNNRKVTQQSRVFRTQRETGNMSSATVAATDNRTRCDAIRHWLTPHRLHCIVLAGVCHRGGHGDVFPRTMVRRGASLAHRARPLVAEMIPGTSTL